MFRAGGSTRILGCRRSGEMSGKLFSRNVLCLLRDGIRCPPRRPKLEPYTGVIDAILEADAKVPRKQRHTAKRIFERLREEYGFDGQHTIVKDYLREHWRQVREMFVPLTHDSGTPSVISERRWR